MTLPLCRFGQGGKGRCRRTMRTMSSGSTAVPAPIAACDLTGPSLMSTRRSTVSSPVSTSAAGGSSPASSPDGTAAGESLCWSGSRAWIATPSPEVGASWTKGTHSRRAGCGAREPGPSAWRSDPRNPEGPGGVAGGRHGRGSRFRHEVDAPLAPRPPKGPQTPGVQGVPPDHRPAVARPALLVADLPQDQGGDPPPGPGPPVPLPDAAAEVVPGAGIARDQRRYQEEGVGG